jgi:hypothetical protein
MRLLPVLATLLFATAANAQDQDAAPPQDPPLVNPMANSSDYLAYHPDLGDRKLGMEAYGRSSYAYAARYFRWAARFADKPSQAMLGSMYWNGQGVPQDRALGYAWMDLAAERQYPSLLAFRERYWQELSEDERKRAVEVGQSLYDEYGDAAAKPRLEVWLRRGLQQITGSHTGFVGSMEIQIPGGHPPSIDANQYYDPHFWKGSQYWATVDRSWKAPPKGVVNVGTLETVLGSKPSAPPQHGPDDRKPADKNPDESKH